MTAQKILCEIKKSASPEQAEKSARFFKLGKGEYGEHDIFLGLSLPSIRQIVKKYKKTVELNDLKELITYPFHEVRSTAVLLAVELFAKNKNEEERQKIVEFYLYHLNYINNWDLIDISVHKILGIYCQEQNDYQILYNLANTDHLWSKRAAIVANWHIIKQGNFEPIKKITLTLCKDKEDLIHKALGWMLREMGKKDLRELLNFLDNYASELPRTTLRYAIERLSPEQRKHYLSTSKNI